MKINNLQQKYLYVYLSSSSSFCINLKYISEVWLVNCFEGCQHVLAKKKIKISQITKIIITSNNTNNISGLLGLLSSISLSTKIKKIDIYGPKQLSKYIFLGRKYSQTNFRYKLYFHFDFEGRVVQEFNLFLSFLVSRRRFSCINYYLTVFQKPAKFSVENALKYKIPSGPLYHLLKLGRNFIFPDGSIIYSKYFISGYYLGSQVFFINNFLRRSTLKIVKKATCCVTI